jgi:saccharopine dehydrogenase (NAD+, L-lysine-forming)
MTRRVMVYGATGFSGRMIAEQLWQDGCDVVLAGRNANRLAELADDMGLDYRVFGLADLGRIEHGLVDIKVLVNAAGPFVDTAPILISACITARTHYLDLAGEWPVFADGQSHSGDAAARGVMLMSGVGFAIVATDCLLAHAAAQARDTVLLRVALSQPSIMSRGTLRSLLALTSSTVVVRRNGALVQVPVGQLERSFDFGDGLRASMAVSWPDVVTGEQTTGVGSIEVYAEASLVSRAVYYSGALAAGIFDEAAVGRSLQTLGAWWPASPSPAARQSAGHVIIAEAVDRWRRVRGFRLRTADGYTVSAFAAAAIAERILVGEAAPGFQTPAGLYGARLIVDIGCARFDDPPPACQLQPPSSRLL